MQILEVSVVGLGAMGAAIARTLLAAGHRVTVWNRSRDKATALVREGAALARTAADAVAASPVVVVCVTDYAASRYILDDGDVAAALTGRVLVQLTTGSPNEARQGERWARERGIDYLDGAIMAIPSQIGTPEAAIFTAGSESAHRGSEPALASLAPERQYLGASVGAAAAMDYAVLSYVFGGLLGAIHGALICESEGIPVDAYGGMLGTLAPGIGQMARHACTTIGAGVFVPPQASVATCLRGLDGIMRHADDAGIDATFPTFAVGLFQRGLAAGIGDQDFAALITALRR